MVRHGGLRLLRVVGMLHTEGNIYGGSHCGAGDSPHTHFNCPARSVCWEHLQPLIWLLSYFREIVTVKQTLSNPAKPQGWPRLAVSRRCSGTPTAGDIGSKFCWGWISFWGTRNHNVLCQSHRQRWQNKLSTRMITSGCPHKNRDFWLWYWKYRWG